MVAAVIDSCPENGHNSSQTTGTVQFQDTGRLATMVQAVRAVLSCIRPRRRTRHLASKHLSVLPHRRGRISLGLEECNRRRLQRLPDDYQEVQRLLPSSPKYYF